MSIKGRQNTQCIYRPHSSRSRQKHGFVWSRWVIGGSQSLLYLRPNLAYILRAPLGIVDREVPIDFDDIGASCYDWFKIGIRLFQIS